MTRKENEAKKCSDDRWKSGAIWQLPTESREIVVQQVCQSLEAEYGFPRLGNPEDPLNDLIFIIVSNKTSSETAQLVYSGIKQRFPTWDDILSTPTDELCSIIKPAGLGMVKSSQIQRLLLAIRRDFGACDLNPLNELEDEVVQEYLVSLPGVSEKVAKCVMIYTLGAKVLPVDAHVHRIAKRLGWTTRKRADQCHRELEALVPPDARHAFHVDCILHGRALCRPNKPKSSQCPIRTYCQYGRSVCQDEQET